MKKFYIALCAFAITLFITGASVWEGSAAVATAGELPDGAYYVATNSFPRNTVVDVTNLENGRTIRVIVAAGLNSPGLLAMLSRNAAIAIGIQTRAVGRIRMTQPSDPVAYSRFTEGQEGEAIPDTPAVVSAPTRAATASDLASASSEDAFFMDVINKPEAYNPLPVAYPNDGSVLTEPLPNWVPDGSEPRPLIAEVRYPDTPPAPPPKPPAAAVPTPDPSSPQQTLVPRPPASSVITLIPADPRPPEGAWALPPASEIGPVQRQEPYRTGGDDNPLDPRYFIGPIYPVPVPPSNRVPASQAPAARVPAVRAMPENPKPLSTNESIFSVPIIGQMQRDRYYIQIGAFNQPDTLQYAVSRIDRRNYPLLVQPFGGLDNLVYRLLVGPLNYGESGAVLQRLKSSGYPDAFVRN